jgi:hypothetical protein
VLDNKLRFEFGLPNRQGRINHTRVHANLKDFDFGQWIKTDRLGWFKYLASNLSPTCADQTVHFVAPLPSMGENATKRLGVTYHQRSDGVIIVTIHRPHKGDTPLVKLEIHLMQGMNQQSATCVYQWKDQESLTDVATHLMRLRNSFVASVGKEKGFNGAEIGTRLSRHKDSSPTQTTPQDHPNGGDSVSIRIPGVATTQPDMPIPASSALVDSTDNTSAIMEHISGVTEGAETVQSDQQVPTTESSEQPNQVHPQTNDSSEASAPTNIDPLGTAINDQSILSNSGSNEST